MGYLWSVSAELAPPEGRRIAGRYELRSVIGRGGAGTVWRAEDVLLQRAVAVKEVHLPTTLSEDERRVLRERVLREARAAAAVRHPVLVSVFDVVEDEDRPWIVLELIEARTLSAVVAERTLSPAETARVGLDLLAALTSVHRAGIQHRDVKPGNVLVEHDGRPRLTDFGIASTAGDPSLTKTGVLLGSPSYLPPERASGGPGGPESDLWSLAATLYACVEGTPPYEGSHPLAVLTAVVEGRRRPAQQAGDLEPLLAELLDRAPADRPDAEDVRERLVAVAGSGLGGLTPDPARKPGLLPREPGQGETDASRPGGTTESTTGMPVADGDGATSALDRPPASAADDAADDATDDATDAESVLDRTQAGPATPARRGPGRRRLLIAAAAALVLLAVGGAVVALAGRGSPPPQESASGAAEPAVVGPATGSLPPAALDPAGIAAARAATPAGWVRYTDPNGWSVAHPPGWTRTRLGKDGVDFVEPGTGSYLHVETSSKAPESVTADWQAQESRLAPRVSNYARVGLTPADGGAGTRAADWEFTFGLAGSPLRALDRGLVADGTGYTLYWQTPADAWENSRGTLAGLLGSFTPA